MHILILGKNGQLGKAMAHILDVHRISYVAVGHADCDVTHPEHVRQCVERYRPTHIVNCTAYTNVDAAEVPDGTKQAMAVNRDGVRNVIDAARLVGAHVTHMSTDYVFDGRGTRPYTEDDTVDPIQVYGASKRAGEEIVLAYDRGLVLRVSWLYGDGEQNFITKFLAFAATRDELSGTEDEVSIPTSTSWLAEIILQCIQHNLTGLYHAVPIGHASRLAWAKEICTIWGLTKNLSPVQLASWNLPAQRPHFTVMDSTRLQQRLGMVFPTWQELLHQFYHSQH